MKEQSRRRLRYQVRLESRVVINPSCYGGAERASAGNVGPLISALFIHHCFWPMSPQCVVTQASLSQKPAAALMNDTCGRYFSVRPRSWRAEKREPRLIAIGSHNNNYRPMSILPSFVRLVPKYCFSEFKLSSALFVWFAFKIWRTVYWITSYNICVKFNNIFYIAYAFAFQIKYTLGLTYTLYINIIYEV